jgi:phage tail sheath gpL-like
VLTLYIGNTKVEIAITASDTAATIAAALKAEIDNNPDLPVTAAVAEAVVTLTARNKGLCGNDIGLGYKLTNTSGVTVTIVGMASGATNPSLTAVLATVFAHKFDVIVTPFNTQEDLTTIETHLDSVSGPIEQRPGTAVYGINGALATATTLSGQINSGRILCAYLRYTSATLRKSMPYEIAAAMGAVMCFEEDPARPLNTLELKGIAVPDIADRLSRTEQENLLYNGVTPIEVINETAQIVRAISTYLQDAQGIDDISLLDITTIRTLDYVRKACRERIALRFPREKLSSKTPAKVKTELLDVLLKLQDLEIVEEVEANKTGLIVERDEQDVNRLNAKIPCDVVNGLHIFAGRIDLLL